MDGIEARLDKIDGRLDRVEARLDTHLTKDEFERTRVADREEMRRHFAIIAQYFERLA